MTRLLTVSFRNEDEGLWAYIEDTRGNPVTGRKIRDILHDWMESQTSMKVDVKK